MLEMQRHLLANRVGLCLTSGSLKHVGALVSVEHYGIATLHIKVGGALEPYVYAESLLALALQFGSVCTVRALVVLPCKVVNAPCVEFTVGIVGCLARCSCHYTKLSHTTRYNVGLNEQLLVVG